MKRYPTVTAIILIGLLSFVSSILLCSKLITDRILYWDRFRLSGLFIDLYNSLQRFNEVPWWQPNVQNGFPSYYLSILGTELGTPLHVLVSFLFWCAAKLEWVPMPVEHFKYLYLKVYMVTIEFIAPFLFLVSLWLFAKQIFRNTYVLAFILIVGAFSPHVIFGLSDESGMQTTYGLLLLAAYMAWVRRPTQKTMGWFAASWVLLLASVDHLWLYWNLFSLSTWMLLTFDWKRARQIFSSGSAALWVLLVLGSGLCILPQAVLFSQGTDIIRTTAKARWYKVEEINEGSPTEFLASATPQIGATSEKGRIIIPGEDGHYTGYLYLGVLTLPLGIIGLIFGRAWWRVRVGAMLMLTSLLIIMATASPIIVKLMTWVPQLGSVSHIGDTTYRLGGFIWLLFGAGLGLEAIIAKRRGAGRFIIPVIGLSMSLSVALNLIFNTKSGLGPFGIYYSLSACLLGMMVIGWVIRARVKRQRLILFALMAFVFLDVSTISFRYVKYKVWRWFNTEYFIKPDGVGVDNGGMYTWLNELLIIRDYKELNETSKVENLPKLAVYCQVREWKSGDPLIKGDSALPVSVEQIKKHQLEELVRVSGGCSGPSKVNILKNSYNSIELDITSPSRAILFYRDNDFPGWAAHVNGKPASIIRAAGTFKGVAVEAGSSTVRFSFSPPLVPMALFFSYGTVVMFFGMALYRHRNISKAGKIEESGGGGHPVGRSATKPKASSQALARQGTSS